MRIRFILVSMALACASAAMAQSPYESSGRFCQVCAMKLRDQALLKVEPQVFVPTTSRSVQSRVTRGKRPSLRPFSGSASRPRVNNPVPNHKSSWDANWTANYGGFDNPDAPRAAQLHPVIVHSAAEPVLLRAAL